MITLMEPVTAVANPTAPPDSGVIADLLVDTLKALRVKGEMLHAALDAIATRDRELASARRQLGALRDEMRRYTARQVMAK